ncbi:winged helix-turn-helix domain-containing protein [Nanoarchaeota archaeon]
MTQKRERIQVIYDILKVIQEKNGNIKPTHIMYKANLSSQMLNEYVSDLIQRKLIVEVKTKSSKEYSLTELGHEYIQKYSSVAEFMNTFGLSS